MAELKSVTDRVSFLGELYMAMMDLAASLKEGLC